VENVSQFETFTEKEIQEREKHQRTFKRQNEFYKFKKYLHSKKKFKIRANIITA